MPPPALHEALRLDPEESVVAYSIWGGVPRNWELAADYDSTGEAVAALILDRNGVLHGDHFASSWTTCAAPSSPTPCWR